MRRFFQSPYRNIVLALLAFLVIAWLRIRATGGLALNLSSIIIDIIVFGLSLLFWLFFFSQFLLPVRNANERISLFGRLLLYISGGHGPAVFIQNGQIIQRKGEGKRRGPGVIILDTASAAVLRRADRFTRAVGPGVVFTDRREYLEGEKAVVDLRLQKQRIGPTLSQADKDTSKKKPDQARLETIRRERMETRALTRDGIEIVPKIFVYFKISSKSGEGNSEFGYNQSAVEKAIIGRNIDADLPSDTPDRLHDWRWIPAHLAAEVWKECVAKFTLNELFNQNMDLRTGLMTILDTIEKRLTLPNVPVLNAVGQPSGEEVTSQEYRLLAERGISVQRIELRDLEMPEEVEKLLMQNWKASWLNQARKESEKVDTLRSYNSENARQEAQDRFTIDTLCHLAGQYPPPGTLSDTLVGLIEGNLEIAERVQQIRQPVQEELDQTRDLIAIVRSMGGSQ